MRYFHDPKWKILSKHSNVQAINTNYKITHHNTPKTLKAYILDTILSISLSSSLMLLLTQLTEQTDIFCSSWRGMCVPIYKNLQLPRTTKRWQKELHYARNFKQKDRCCYFSFNQSLESQLQYWLEMFP